ncbi:glyoxalase/bleomycin resistance protein/dioxygenase [Hyaloraphidium curvatum]|nr:glyoxalase/bleomycin resistance protein/dioxygenase [Hyaloraphidium curvatum]
MYTAPAPHVRIRDVAFVRFRVPDLALESAFFRDFGLDEINGHPGHFRGLGNEPVVVVLEQGPLGFGGVGLRVGSGEELKVFAGRVGGKVEGMGGAWAGAEVVRIRDPDGNLVELLAGGPWGAAPVPTREPLNEAAGAGYRRTNATKRVPAGRSRVVRLGHVVLDVASFGGSERWYKDHFGLITSDEVQGPGGKGVVGAFMRCDRGDEPTDHHTFFLVNTPPGKKPHFNHAAFEVVDLDDLMAGSAHLLARKAEHTWGVGRHVLGSQVFDYWNSPHGFTVEHFTDGDLLNRGWGSREAPLQALFDTQWGDPVPGAGMGSSGLAKL